MLFFLLFSALTKKHLFNRNSFLQPLFPVVPGKAVNEKDIPHTHRMWLPLFLDQRFEPEQKDLFMTLFVAKNFEFPIPVL